MSKIEAMKNDFWFAGLQKIIEEVMKGLEDANELKEQGKDVESRELVKDMIDWLEELIKENEKLMESEEPLAIERSSLPQKGAMVAIGDKVILGVLREDEKEKYLSIDAEYSVLKGMHKEAKYSESVWEDFLSDSSFVCSIYKKNSGEYIGYCAVKRLVKGDWELAIELEPDACHQGYGTEALLLLMQALHMFTGKRFFRARVEIDNHASQGMMKKLGATPNGISESLLHGKEIEKFREECKEEITEEIREVAAEFCMDAEDILGYVLEYRLDVKKMEGVEI